MFWYCHLCFLHHHRCWKRHLVNDVRFYAIYTYLYSLEMRKYIIYRSCLEAPQFYAHTQYIYPSLLHISSHISSTYYRASPFNVVVRSRFLFAFAFGFNTGNYDCWGYYCIHLYGNFASIKYFQVARLKTHSHIFSSTSTIFLTHVHPHPHTYPHESIHVHTQI